jgi:Fe-S cluster biogenesis protein NfuA
MTTSATSHTSSHTSSHASTNGERPSEEAEASLEARIQSVLDGYRPTLYLDGGDVQLLQVDEKGIAHVKMLGACIDCPVSLLTMKLGIQRLLKEHFSEIRGVNAITDLELSALYNRQAPV